MLEAIRDFLGNLRAPKPRPVCDTCEAYRGQIQDLKEERAFLHGQIETLQQALFRAVRIAEQVRSHSERTSEPMATMPPLWHSMKQQLEAKHRRKAQGGPPPEDKVADHWTEKIAEMEREGEIRASQEQ